jgi:hypothetical protein
MDGITVVEKLRAIPTPKEPVVVFSMVNWNDGALLGQF